MQESRIKELILGSYNPAHLEVVNESHRHSLGRPETHFKVVMVSDDFAGQKTFKRHQAVNQLLSPVFSDVHSIALQLYTPEEWSQREEKANASPNCRGG